MGSFTASDGVEIVYDDHPGDGVPVVLHHGFAASAAANWDAPGITARLIGSGRRVVALDARGHGRSGTPHDPAAYDAPAMPRDVSSLLDHLGVDEVDLVGYSMGGFVALDVATRDTRLRSLVVGGIGAGALPTEDGAGPPIDRDAIARVMEADELGEDVDAGAVGFRRLAEATGSDRRALAAVLRATPHRPGDLATVDVPALVLAGDHDPLAWGADRLAAELPRAQLVTVPGNHTSAVASPELVEALLAFLAERDAG